MNGSSVLPRNACPAPQQGMGKRSLYGGGLREFNWRLIIKEQVVYTISGNTCLLFLIHTNDAKLKLYFQNNKCKERKSRIN